MDEHLPRDFLWNVTIQNCRRLVRLKYQGRLSMTYLCLPVQEMEMGALANLHVILLEKPVFPIYDSRSRRFRNYESNWTICSFNRLPDANESTVIGVRTTWI